MHPTTEYVHALIAPLIPEGLRAIKDVEGHGELRITVFVTSARAKGWIIGRGGENIHAIQHLARELQHHREPAVKVRIDVILSEQGKGV